MSAEAVLKDLFTVLPDGYVHLGGDEVTTACWTKSERISKSVPSCIFMHFHAFGSRPTVQLTTGYNVISRTFVISPEPARASTTQVDVREGADG
jgi:hypothetical protein